jgi:hypothetical protein
MIPKKIHYCWISGDPYPELIAKCIDSWHRYLSDYEFVLWDAKKIQETSILSCVWLKEAYDLNRKESVADYVRIYALFTEGGIYLDSDVEVVKDMSPLLEHQSFMGYETKGDFEAGIIGAEAGTVWLKDWLDYYQSRHFCNSDGSLLDFQPMPTKLCKVLYSSYEIPKEIPKPILIASADLMVFPCDYFSPKNNHTGKVEMTKNTYTIHHFDNHWINKNLIWHIKKIIHKILIFIFGQDMHNAIIQKIQKNKNIN